MFYSHWNVPDTPLGRFEMLSLHMFLFQHRLRGEDGAAREIAQVLIDEFFLDVDHSLRELGIGDVGVPKRMKKLAKMFYGRTAAYDDALERNDHDGARPRPLPAMSGPTPAPGREAPLLADYVADACRQLAAQPSESIVCRHGGVSGSPTGRS